MKSRLNSNQIQYLRTLAKAKGIDPNSIKDSFFYRLTDFRSVLLRIGRIIHGHEIHEELNVNIEFEPHPLSDLDTQVGLFYIDSILGFDTYSRKWHIGDVATWREEAQKLAFEDNWRRWIELDFIYEIKHTFSIEIDESINAFRIRRLFDIACRRAKYRCLIVEPGKDCYCNIEILVEQIGYEDLDDYLIYQKPEECIEYVVRYFSVNLAQKQMTEMKAVGIHAYGLEDMTGSEDYLAPGREPEVYVVFDVPLKLETDFRKLYSSLDAGISIKRDGEEIARAIPPSTPEEHRLWCELSQEAYDELVEND